MIDNSGTSHKQSQILMYLSYEEAHASILLLTPHGTKCCYLSKPVKAIRVGRYFANEANYSLSSQTIEQLKTHNSVIFLPMRQSLFYF